jgi:sulfonate transport system substrate-binding protein
MQRPNFLSACVLAGGLALALGVGQRAAAEPLKLRAAWIATPASLIPILFEKPGLAKHNGVTYQFEPTYYTSSPTQITALASGELEIGTLNFTSFPFAILNAKLDLRIVADDTVDGFADYFTVRYTVRRDGPIKQIEDLKGHVLGVIGIGAATDIAMRTELLKHGLHSPADYSLVEVRPPNGKAMLLDQKVELIAAGLPWAYDPELIEKGRTIFTMKDALGPSALSFWVVREDFIKAHRAALIDLLEDTVRAYRWYADPANHQEAVEILARATKQPAERLTDWAFTKKGIYRNPDGVPDAAMIQRDVDAMTKLGFIKDTLDIKPYMDLSLVEEAGKRVK